MYEAGSGRCNGVEFVDAIPEDIDGIFGDIVGFVGKAVATVAKPALTVVGGAAGSIIPGAGTAVGAAIGGWVGGQVSGALSGGGAGGGSGPPAQARSPQAYTGPRGPVRLSSYELAMKSRAASPARAPVARSAAPAGFRPGVVNAPMSTGKKVAIAGGAAGALGLTALVLALL